MLIGEHNHILDPKKRVSLPAKFRKEMGAEVVITRGLDSCLFIYTVSEWTKVAEDLSRRDMFNADARSINRFLLGGATLAEIDSIGRVLIPEVLKEFAGLKEDVVIIGMYSRLEVWDKDKWKAYRSENEKQADQLAEKLSRAGAI